MKIETDNGEIVCDVQYGKCKCISIHMDTVGFITVKAPRNTSEEAVIDVIKRNSNVIQEKLDNISKIQQRPKTRVYDDRGKFFYLGKECLLNELIDVGTLEEEALKANLKKFYVTSCKKIVSERIKIYAKQLGVAPKTVAVIQSKHQWGSCNTHKEISFNYRLAMAPLELIDYVVVHELCHLMHMNHDRSFWRRVGSIMPDYKKRQDALARLGQFMTL
ncbi:MAG: M48 family metallopeptidase [Hyphomonadaceae bacterium]|nr:M48 family metallopeptidase [Clostridia bacterium]